MRDETNKASLRRFMEELGAAAKGPGQIYLTGGGTAVLIGWREMTVDIDIAAIPEPPGFFEAIAQLKETLNVNVELASPHDFIPELPGWQSRSLFIARHGPIDFFHYDFYAQALAKIERGHGRDLADVRAMLEGEMVTRQLLWEMFLKIEHALVRYPGIEPGAFRAAVAEICGVSPHD
jgi:Nucleotidyltransferase of unknown function (DUF6036)